MPLSAPTRPLAVPSSVLGEKVYVALLDAIITGELAPGEVVKEVELADSLGVSRTPVREATRRLAELGLLHIEANRGSRVAEIVPAYLLELGEVLAELAGLCARRALPRLSDADLTWIEAVFARTADEAKSDHGPPDRLLAEDVFSLLLERADNGVLANVVSSLRPHFVRCFTLYGRRLSRIDMGESATSLLAAARAADVERFGDGVRAYYRHVVLELVDVITADRTT